MALYDGDVAMRYARLRRADPKIAEALDQMLGDVVSVLNVGAGAGSYETPGKTLLAVEPSHVMIRQRPLGSPPCICARAEALPLRSDAVDAAMAVLTVHHWTDLERGLNEMARVARRRVVLLTWVPDAAPFWLTHDYFPEIAAHDLTLFPTQALLTDLLKRMIGPVSIKPVPLTHDCADGLLCAYWRRPSSYLDPEVRGVMSSFARIDAAPGLLRLSDDLISGRWMQRYGRLMTLPNLDLGYRIVGCDL